MADMVGVAEIAEQIKVEVTTVRRLIARHSDSIGIVPHRGKGDKVLLSRDDANKIITFYQSRRGPVSASENDQTKYDRYGYFYIIQLIPEVLPDRVKIGFTDNVEKRLTEHRTSAPTAALIKSWPCKRSWDYAAMDSISRDGCKLVLNEVYEGNVEGFISRGDNFFSLMPDPDTEKELSPHSPLNEDSDSD